MTFTIDGGITFSGAGVTFTAPPIIKKAIFGYGYALVTTYTALTNLVSNTGVVGNDVTGVGTARWQLTAAGYGNDKAIFGYGAGSPGGFVTNLVSNTGVVANDVAGVGTSRQNLAAATYGTDKAIFGYGQTFVSGQPATAITNLVSNTGVVAADTTGVGTVRYYLAAAGYGTDKAIFGYGYDSAGTPFQTYSMTNLVSNTGVVAADTTGVGPSRLGLAATGYGTDKAIFGFGAAGPAGLWINLVSNTGVVATNTNAVGTARTNLAAAGYGLDKAIFGYGSTTTYSVTYSVTNLVSNTGAVATDTTGVGTARGGLAAASYSS